ncbi:arginase [Deinococcus sp. MIMF12]|uniref:Arginase n=1 Tax=Deinococcus rhizophilus TaxID=3049544 RepID=A0ABT7JDZ9_9DEIO|nr:arginase [Deinococcus rhizophilus]MDL2343281.1 arginase [Deinococcus rhizophilus]
MLLSIDWDALSGTRELVFDAPIWGTRDREEDRVEAWRERARRRGGQGWEGLTADFPLYPGGEALERYAGIPAHVTLTHADAWDWLAAFPGADVLNVDSHHDLASLSGDPARVRPGNWAGLALASGRVRRYTCLYPAWHAEVPVAEGYDLERTWGEVAPLLAPGVRDRVTLRRMDDPAAGLPDPAEVAALLLVQSPAWTSPAHDPAFFRLARKLNAAPLTPPLDRSAAW